MRTRIKYALSFLFGVIYLWSLQNAFRTNMDFTILSDWLAAFILGGGGIFILTCIFNFFVDVWNTE